MGRVLRVGITGGIGSGKSTIGRVFESLGVPVYHADERARWLTEHHPEIRIEITALLGPKAYDSHGRYDRQFVSSRVFRDRALLNSLNHIVHPRVQEDTRLWVDSYAARPYVVKEAAIMSRAGAHNGLDYVVAVISPEPLRTERILARDPHRSSEQVRSIMASQATDADLHAMADFIVRNNEKELVIPQVLEIHERLLAAHSGEACH